MDQFVDRQRLQALKIICQAYRPGISLSSLNLGFVTPEEICEWMTLKKIPLEASRTHLDTKRVFPLVLRLWEEQSTKGVDIKGQIH